MDGDRVTLDDRKLEVLRVIVEDYVATQEPVGSKALVERHKLRVSPATVRNDMAALEEEGYLRQPHTSAGRVPTNKGYRLFVDRLSRIKPPSRRDTMERDRSPVRVHSRRGYCPSAARWIDQQPVHLAIAVGLECDPKRKLRDEKVSQALRAEA